MNVASTIKSIQDIMRKDDGIDGDAQRIGQLTWMIFLKVFDQAEERLERESAKRGEQYRSPLPKECRWRNWAQIGVNSDGVKDSKVPKSRIVSHVNEVVFPKLRTLRGKKNPKAQVIRSVFEDTINYMKSGQLMVGVIEKLDDVVDIKDAETRKNIGDIYEQILNDLRAAGNAGEFYTPRDVTQFMVEMVNPRLRKREIVLDPACGTGGFLTATIKHFRGKRTKPLAPKKREEMAKCLRGMEKKHLPHMLCVTNMLLHGIDVPSQIERRNTLAHPWKKWKTQDQVDCIITNPPFGGLEDEEVGADYPEDVRTRETADMFLTLIIKKLLKDKGRGAVVLPDGTLFGEGIKSKVKELLLTECNLHTIVRLPNGVFNPYTGIKTNLLFFTKGKPTETIWYYEHRYPEGQKSYSKTRPLRIEEFDPIKAWWGKEHGGFADRVETEQAWMYDFKKARTEAEAKRKPHQDKAEQLLKEASVLNNKIIKLRAAARKEKKAPAKKKLQQELDTAQASYDSLVDQAKEEKAIGDRHYWPIYDLDRKNKNAPEAETHDLDALLGKYKKLLSEIAETENELRDELAAALAHQFVGGQW